MFTVGLLLSALLLAFGLGTAARQRRVLKRLAEERFLPSDERAYLRGQVRRRLLTSTAVSFIGVMIGWSYLSGTEARATEIAERSRRADLVDPLMPPVPPAPPTDEEKAFVRHYGYFWLAVLGLVFVSLCCAVFDFWAARRYWMAQYRILRADHEAKLRRDLAVYRHAKDNERMSGLNDPKSDDATDEPPPKD